MRKEERVPAIPPNDYTGSIADWMVKLQEKGLWNGKNPEFHGDIQIKSNDWWEILEECEDETGSN